MSEQIENPILSKKEKAHLKYLEKKERWPVTAEKKIERNIIAREKYHQNKEQILEKRKLKRVTCEHCPFTFCSNWYLKDHMKRRHSDVNPQDGHIL